jgi:hypothetical protein
MKAAVFLVSFAISVAACSKSGDNAPTNGAKEAPPGPMQCAHEVHESEIYPAFGNYADDEGNLVIAEAGVQNWEKNSDKPQMRIAVPSVIAKLFPKESPYQRTIVPLGLDRCGNFMATTGEASTLEDGTQIRFDVTLKGDFIDDIRLVQVTSSGEKELAKLQVHKLKPAENETVFLNGLKPIVRQYMEEHLDPSDAYTSLTWLAQWGRTSAMKSVVEKYQDKLSADEFRDGIQEAIRQGNSAQVELLLPHVRPEDRKNLHCSISLGYGSKAWGDVRKAMQVGIPTNLENTDILNLLLRNGNQFGRCPDVEKRAQILANVANAETLGLLGKIDGIGTAADGYPGGDPMPIFWLSFQNNHLRNSGFALSDYLNKIGYIGKIKGSEFRERLFLRGMAQWQTISNFLAAKTLLNADSAVVNQVENEISKDIDSLKQTIESDKSFAERYYFSERLKRYEEKIPFFY